MTNGKFDITHDGRTTLNVDRDGALASGYPEAVVAAVEAAARRAQVSQECRRRIYMEASPETQMNMTMVLGLISAKTASERTSEEADTLAGLDLAAQWVQDMRANVDVLAADVNADFTDDALWPDVPSEAAAVAALY